MKFKRLLAAILSALMVASCVGFVANAQEDSAELAATGLLKEFGSKAGGLGGLGGQMDNSSTYKKYYDAVNDVLFTRYKINDDATGGTFHMNWSSTAAITIDTDDNTVHGAYKIRVNKPGAVPMARLYQVTYKEGLSTYKKDHNGTAITGDGNWEIAKIAITEPNLTQFKQSQTFLAGSSSLPAGFWFDIAHGAFASDEATAVSAVSDTTKYASDYNITFNLNYGDSANLDTYPTEIPDRTDDGFAFEGWATKANATEAEVEYTDLTCVAVPTADTTYYAVWGDLIEDEKAIYISANGDDTNGGRHSQDAIATIAKADALFEAEGNEALDTLYVIGSTEPLTYTKDDGSIEASSLGFGTTKKTIKIRGYTGNSDVFHATNAHLGFNGDLDFDNITIKQGSGDGKLMAQGHNAYFGENVIVTGSKAFSHRYYERRGDHWYGDSSSNPADATATFKGGSWVDVHGGVWTNDSTFYGNSTIIVDGATITNIKLGHGSGTNQVFKGYFKVNVESGTVSNINLDSSTANAVNSYDGVRYFTLNGGVVTGGITVTSKDSSSNGTKASSADDGYTIVEINAPNIFKGNIKQGADDDDAERIVIYNNNSYVAGQVTDESAIVIIPTNGTIKADVTVNSDFTATLNGYTYTTDSTNKYININGTNYQLSDFANVDATLAEEVTVLIPANLFEAGENAAVFSETPLYEINWVNGEETVKTETAAQGTTLVAPELTKTGYTLSWTPEVTEVSADATYTAVWTANKHNVIYMLDGAEYSKTEVAYGTAVEILDAPSKEGYTFGGWKMGENDAADFTMPDEDVTITGAYTLNNYTITFNAGEGKFSDDTTEKTVTADHGTTPTAPEAPTFDGYTFKEWTPAIVVATGAATYTATYEKSFATTPTYNTYGKYDALSGKYTVELKFSGAKVNQGSFGFNFPTEQMTLKSVTANAEAGIEFLGNISPIYANGAGFYADTWAVATGTNAGNVDATTEEVLIATFVFDMTDTQREAFVNAGATLTEYVVENANTKYHNGTNYLVTPYSTGFDTTKQAVVYDSHTDEEITTSVEYTTYGKYDEYNGTYSIDIKVKGAKINLGAFGLKFNSEYMTFKPDAENAVVFADGIANYLDVVLNNTAEGYAFTFDGSSQSEGYIDATEEEVLIATINLTMTAEQRVAFEANGKTMEIFVPTANDNIDAATLAKYYDGTSYIANLYTNGLDIPKVSAVYKAHIDEVVEATLADVDVTVTFASKQGETVSNIAKIKLDDDAAIELEEAGNENATLTYSFKGLEIGKTYKVTVEKNGYLAGVAEITVVKGENTIEMTLLAGDIKGAETDNCGDGKIDLSDFVRLIRGFDTDASDDFLANVDLDENGYVNVTDLAILKSNYNKTSADNTITINGESNSEEAAG